MSVRVEPLVSVVIPFFNTARYLPECIESVIRQSYTNWECVLVNNCSTDGSEEIAEAYAVKDPRFRLVSNDIFLDQVHNYNRALRLISPESSYCKVVQADDWIFPTCLAEMVSVAHSNPSVGIVGSYYLSGIQVKGCGLPYPSTVVPGTEICRFHLLHHPDKYLLGTPTSVMYRSDLVRGRDPFYDESSLLEDYEVCYYLLSVSDFGFVHQVLSFLRVEDESLTGKIKDFDPYLLHAFICLKKYGELYLSEEEFRERMQQISRRYFEALARGVLYRSGREFWEYHCRGLELIGNPLSAGTFAKYLFLESLDILRHPKEAARVLARYRWPKGLASEKKAIGAVKVSGT